MQKLHGKEKKIKKQTNKQRNEMTISKDNEILSLLKLKDNKIVFIGDLEHFNPLLNSKTKT